MPCRRICGDEGARQVAVDCGATHIIAGSRIGCDVLWCDNSLVVPGSERLPGDRHALIAGAMHAALQVGCQIFDCQRRLDQFTVDSGVQFRLCAVARRVDPTPLDVQVEDDGLA
jgi:hypothetical protein